jgi:hypothetical protein
VSIWGKPCSHTNWATTSREHFGIEIATHLAVQPDRGASIDARWRSPPPVAACPSRKPAHSWHLSDRTGRASPGYRGSKGLGLRRRDSSYAACLAKDLPDGGLLARQAHTSLLEGRVALHIRENRFWDTEHAASVDEAQKVHANPSPLCRNLFCPWRCISVQQDDQSWPSCQEYLSSHVRMMVRNIQPNRLGNGSPGLVLLILPLLSQHYANDNHAYSRCDCPNVAHLTSRDCWLSCCGDSVDEASSLFSSAHGVIDDLSNRWATQRFHSSLCLLRACTYFPVMSRTSTCFVFPVVCLRVRNRSLQFRTNVGRSLYPYSFALN